MVSLQLLHMQWSPDHPYPHWVVRGHYTKVFTTPSLDEALLVMWWWAQFNLVADKEYTTQQHTLRTTARTTLIEGELADLSDLLSGLNL